MSEGMGMILKRPWRGRWKAAEPEEEEEEEEANWRTGEEPEVWKKRWIVWETVQRCVISGRPGGREGGIEGNKCRLGAGEKIVGAARKNCAF